MEKAFSTNRYATLKGSLGSSLLRNEVKDAKKS